MSVLINPSWWLLWAALVVVLLARDPRLALRSALKRVTLSPVLVALACAALANLGLRATLGDVVPGDFVQEVVAARQIQANNTLYPADIDARVSAWLAEEPTAVPAWLPAALRGWLEDRKTEGRNRLVAQAHPPSLLLATVPLVRTLGARGAYWTVTLLTIAAATLSAQVLLGVLVPGASFRLRVLAACLLVSWQPVLATVREGQVSVIIGTLVVVTWSGLRRGRAGVAGIAAGLASVLKLYPLLVLLPLAHSRRALAAVMLVVLAAAGATVAVAGTTAWVEYAASAHLIGRAFDNAPHNVSLVARIGSLVTGSWQWMAHGLVGAGLVAITWLELCRSQPPQGPGQVSDAAFAAFAVLAVLLSPVAWHHYVFMLILPLAVVGVRAWHSELRTALAGVLVLALLLSIPDDLWRIAWMRLPDRVSLLVSPGVAALVLWAWLLHLSVRDRRDGRAAAQAISGTGLRTDSAQQVLLRARP